MGPATLWKDSLDESERDELEHCHEDYLRSHEVILARSLISPAWEIQARHQVPDIYTLFIQAGHEFGDSTRAALASNTRFFSARSFAFIIAYLLRLARPFSISALSAQ